jgi:hypothetical protein
LGALFRLFRFDGLQLSVGGGELRFENFHPMDEGIGVYRRWWILGLSGEKRRSQNYRNKNPQPSEDKPFGRRHVSLLPSSLTKNHSIPAANDQDGLDIPETS